jgi:menaquinone-specific isochorismate synthase
VNLRVRTEPLEDRRPLLDLVPDVPVGERFAFIRDGDGFVGWGIAARLPVGTGPDRFRRTSAALRDLAARATKVPTSSELPDLPGAGLLALASFTFDEDDDGSVVVVPRRIIGRRDGSTWLTSVDAEGSPSVPDNVAPARGTEGGRSQDRPRFGGSTLRDDAWLEAVATALRDIDAGSYEKVVLARDLNLWSRGPFDVAQVLRDLTHRFPSCSTFLVDHLVGASPELLIRRAGGTASSRVLAGTAARSDDPAQDQALGDALLSSDKDLREHELAVRSVVEALESLCDLDVPDRPWLVRLDNVQHLGSDIGATIRSASAATGAGDVLDLLERLHPTAAVGGSPRAPALAAIRRYEGMERGRYAGPVGWCTPEGEGEFAIALRCAEVRGTRARLFAGAGVVAGSLPEAELTETWLKLQAMTGVLGRPGPAPLAGSGP